jgi:hypothetical protein
MSEAWCTLRDHLAASIDEQIAAQPDPELRAMLTVGRDRILDHMELVVLRRMMAERELAVERSGPLN